MRIEQALARKLLYRGLGLLPPSGNGADLVRADLARLTRGATLITSTCFDDDRTLAQNALTGALLDRLDPHVKFLEMRRRKLSLGQARPARTG